MFRKVKRIILIADSFCAKHSLGELHHILPEAHFSVYPLLDWRDYQEGRSDNYILALDRCSLQEQCQGAETCNIIIIMIKIILRILLHTCSICPDKTSGTDGSRSASHSPQKPGDLKKIMFQKKFKNFRNSKRIFRPIFSLKFNSKLNLKKGHF